MECTVLANEGRNVNTKSVVGNEEGLEGTGGPSLAPPQGYLILAVLVTLLDVFPPEISQLLPAAEAKDADDDDELVADVDSLVRCIAQVPGDLLVIQNVRLRAPPQPFLAH